MKEHGPRRPANHGCAGIHEKGKFIQYLPDELAAHDNDRDTHHKAENHEKEIPVRCSGDGKDIVYGHEKVCQDDCLHRGPKIIRRLHMGIFIARRNEMNGNRNEQQPPLPPEDRES